jgi:hypothetical protein
MISYIRVSIPFLFLSLIGTACAFSNLTDIAPQRDPKIIFQDDFSTYDGGWDRIRDEEGITDYDQGGYRIQVLKPDTDFWSLPGLNFENVRIEVDVWRLAGPTENDFGVLCRYLDEENFYFFLVGNDGFFVVGKFKNGTQSYLGMDTFGYHQAINKGENAVNKLRIDCVKENLTLYVNGDFIVEVQDDDFPSGDVGLIAGTFGEPGTDVLFDNFVVRDPN